MPPNRLYLLLICLLTIASCVDDLDFSQVEDYTASPILSFSLAHFNIAARDFTPSAGSPDVTEITQKSDFKIFENKVIKNNLIKIDFQFEISNEFNKDFTIEISLLDSNDNLINKLDDLKVEANKINTEYLRSISVNDIQNIKKLSKVTITIKLDDATRPLKPTDIGLVEFKSASTIYLGTN